MVYELHPNIAGKTTTLPCYMTVEFTLREQNYWLEKKKFWFPTPLPHSHRGSNLLNLHITQNVRGFFMRMIVLLSETI